MCPLPRYVLTPDMLEVFWAGPMVAELPIPETTPCRYLSNECILLQAWGSPNFDSRALGRTRSVLWLRRNHGFPLFIACVLSDSTKRAC